MFGDRKGFSLIEVTLAVGIVSFAILPVMALLPIGLNINRQSIEATVSSQIIARITRELQQTDFSSLPSSPSSPLTYCFDDQGNLLASGNNSALPALTSGQRALRIYDVLASVNKQSSLPGISGAISTLATVRIDIISDPAGSATILSGTFSKSNFSTYFAFISKND